MVFIAWGITGAGHFLRETFALMEQVAASKDTKVTAFLTRAAIEVVRMYGLWDSLRKLSNGTYYSEILSQESEGWSSPSAGRLSRGTYRVMLVSPASANTVAKLRYGIADTAVTNAAAQAMRSGTPVLILPTDQTTEEVETTLPCRVDREACKACQDCPSARACRSAAFERVQDKMRIRLSLCIGCCACVSACPYGATRFGERIKIKPRMIDVENVVALRSMAGLTVQRSPEELKQSIHKLLEGSGN